MPGYDRNKPHISLWLLLKPEFRRQNLHTGQVVDQLRLLDNYDSEKKRSYWIRRYMTLLQTRYAGRFWRASIRDVHSPPNYRQIHEESDHEDSFKQNQHDYE